MRSLLICFLFLCSCSNGQKEALVKKDISLVSFSAQNQLDKNWNAMGWIEKEGVVPYDIHWGWKCSNQGDKSFIWLSQKNISGLKNEIINVSEENC
jgi:hypothetical protein